MKKRFLILFILILGCSSNDDMPCVDCGDNYSNLDSSGSSGSSSSNSFRPGNSSSSGSSYSSGNSSSSLIINACPNSTVGSNTMTCGNQTYKIVNINDQIWMEENLNYNASGSKCYDDNKNYCAQYGRLYDWSAAKAVCPNGWHLPSKEEWDALIDFVGGSIAGTKLKAASGWADDGNGTDDHDFAALPGGGYYSGNFPYAGYYYYGYWWTESEHNDYGAYCLDMGYASEDATWHLTSKSYLFSVRCLKN